MPSADSRENPKVIVMGAGPAGLTAAYELSKAGVASLVFEKDSIVGGISRTVNYKNYFFDIGGHRFFTKIEAVERMWKEVLGDDLLTRNRLSRIYYNKKFFYYPLRPFNALFGLGIFNSFRILASYIHAQLFPHGAEETFEQWVSNRFGRKLYEVFFKTYTEKVWGIPCTEIRAEWAAQRIKGLSLSSVLKNALVGSNRIGSDKNNVIKTLIDRFEYPKLGPGMMWQAVADAIRENGSQVLLENEVRRIYRSEQRIEAVDVKNRDGSRIISGTHFISSLPLQELVARLDPPAPGEIYEFAAQLKYRDFLTIALIVDQRDLFPDNWIYVHDPNVRVGRIQNFKNWSPYMVPDPDKTCLGLEYFCFEGNDLWNMQDHELIDLAKRELATLDLVDPDDVEDGKVVRVPKAYPIYDSNYKGAVEGLRKFLLRFENLQLVGRNGMHRYNNQDHSMLTAMLAAENILGARHDLWAVNADPDYHEELGDEAAPRTSLNKLLEGVFSRLDEGAFATAVGSVCGLLIFLVTIALIFKGGKVVGPNLQLLNQYFIGYSVTLKGAFIGMAYSFFWGFLFGWLFAYLRNFMLAFTIYRLKRKVEMLTFRDFLDHF